MSESNSSEVGMQLHSYIIAGPVCTCNPGMPHFHWVWTDRGHRVLEQGIDSVLNPSTSTWTVLPPYSSLGETHVSKDPLEIRDGTCNCVIKQLDRALLRDINWDVFMFSHADFMYLWNFLWKWRLTLKHTLLKKKGLWTPQVFFSSFCLILGIQKWHAASAPGQAPFPWKWTQWDAHRVNLQKHSAFSEHETNVKLCNSGVIPYFQWSYIGWGKRNIPG